MTPELVEETIAVAGRGLRIVRPARPEDLIDEHAFAEDEYLPYWAELWPSALALAGAIAGRDLRDRRVLEIGCGLGLPALVAAAGGGRVLATDWSPDAVRAAAANARRNGLRMRTAVWRWTDDPAPLAPPFDVVLGSDLLYERRNGPWLLEALPGLVAAGGEVWLADPGRHTASAFFEAAPRLFDVAAAPVAANGRVRVYRLTRAPRPPERRRPARPAARPRPAAGGPGREAR